MDQGRAHSHLEVRPQVAVVEAGGSESVAYHYHHYHYHHHRRSPQPGDVASGGELLTSSTHVQPGFVPLIELKARAVLTAHNIPDAGAAKQLVSGVINFEQTPQGVHITGRIDGLGQGTSHGFHVHEFGDVSSGCTTTGAHFNPFNRVHGGLNDAERHLGDMGNVTADAYGVAHLDIHDPLMSLHGEHSIVGRAIVVHAMPDDLGRGGNEESMKTGNSGARLACGIIGLTNPQTV